MQSAGKRLQAKDSKRAAILASARELFNKGGFRATSMEAIAQAAGIAKGTLYLYFPGKDALFTHLLEENLSRALDERRNLAARCGDPVDALAEIWRGQVSAYLENPAFFGPHPPRVGDSVAALQQAHTGLIVDLFRNLARTDRLRRPDAEQAANLFLAALHGVFLFSGRIGDREALPAFSRAMFESLVHGILC